MNTPSVLIVDDNPQNIRLTAALLQPEGYNLAFAQRGEDALSQISERQFDLILLDVMMPGMDGFETCRRIKKNPEYRDVPVIFLTARDDTDSLVEGFEAGGVDYVAKPFHGAELLARTRAQVGLRQAQLRVEEINAKLNKQILKSMKAEEELAQINVELNRLASTDTLTGLANRRQMTSIAEFELERAERTGARPSVIMCDIDHFKRINDRFGHDCGDAVISGVAQVIQSSVRRQDLCARWGGEEFLIFLPDTSPKGAAVVAEKIRDAVAQGAYRCENSEVTPTLTLGIAGCQAGTAFYEAVGRADRAMYRGKENGRNQVVTADESDGTPGNQDSHLAGR